MLVGQTHSYLKGQLGVKKKVLVFFFAFCFFRTRVSIHFQFNHIGGKKGKIKKKNVPPQGNILRKTNILDFSSGLL